jgi:FtsP/CotA-like multicopper oxidase with cupredoxin domain
VPRRRRRIRPLPAALLAAALGTLAACAGAEPAGSGAAPAAEGLHVTATVSAGTVQTASPRVEVERGATVRITVTSDVADEVHVHGFGDPVLELTPGTPATLEVAADTDGLYEVETHDSGLLLFQLLVR